MKRLQLRIEPFVKALVVQVIDMEGDFKSSGHITINKYNMPYLRRTRISFNGKSDVLVIEFDTNEERDKYFDQMIDWITNELFADVTYYNKDNIFTWDAD